MVDFHRVVACLRKRPDLPRPPRARPRRTALRLLAVGAIAAAVGLAPTAATSAVGAPRPPGHVSAAPAGAPSPSTSATPSSSPTKTAADGASYTAANLPDWAIGPFTRSADNPLMTPSGSGYEAGALYNPGVLYRGGQYKMLYRAQGSYGGPSQIGYASSKDGTHFAEDTAANPVIGFGLAGQQDKCGLEDPRLFELHGTYYSFFTSVHPKADGSCLGSYDIAESTSSDGVHWSTPWTVEPNAGNNKDAAVVTDANGSPRKVNGEYVMYFGQGDTGTDIAYSSDLRTWHAKGSTTARTADPLDIHYPKGWQPYEVSVAVTDYRTVVGRPANSDIVVFTAGTLMANGRWFYAISEEEFSGQDPTRMLHQLSDAVLTPTPDVPYEWNGQTPKTAWMNSIFFHDGQWMMYYGAGDTVTGLATAGLRRPLPARPAGTPFQTGFEHGQPAPDWVDSVDTSPGGGGIANVTAYGGATGPEASARQENDHDGTNALMYSGHATGAADDHAYLRLFDLSDRPVRVGRDTTLSYWIYPQANGPSATGVSGDNSSCVAPDLVFSDGSTLHSLRGSPLTPASQCGKLTLGRWNQVSVDIGKAAAGRKIVRVDLGYDQPAGSGATAATSTTSRSRTPRHIPRRSAASHRRRLPRASRSPSPARASAPPRAAGTCCCPTAASTGAGRATWARSRSTTGRTGPSPSRCRGPAARRSRRVRGRRTSGGSNPAAPRASRWSPGPAGRPAAGSSPSHPPTRCRTTSTTWASRPTPTAVAARSTTAPTRTPPTRSPRPRRTRSPPAYP